MKQKEADIIAKAIRNSSKTLKDKKEIANVIISEMLKIDQFFNYKRFNNLAIHEFPEGWPNRIDDAWIKGNNND